MKTWIYFIVIAMLLFAGCAKDEMFTDDMNLKSDELKSIPIRGEWHSVPTAWDEYGGTTAGYLVGNLTHLGKLIPEQSPYITTSSDYSEFPIIKYSMEGHVCAANGDYLFYTLEGTLDTTTGIVEADLIYPGGTGRLEKYTGYAHFTGQLDPITGYVYATTEGVLYH